MYHLTKIIWKKSKGEQLTEALVTKQKIQFPAGYKLIGEAHNDKGKFLQLTIHIEKEAATPENICDAINHMIEYFKNK